MEVRRSLGVDGLHARRVVDVRDRRDVGAHDVRAASSPATVRVAARGRRRRCARRATGATSSMYGVSAGRSRTTRRVLGEHRRGERAEALAELDLEVHRRLHARRRAGRRGCCARPAPAGRTPSGPGTSRRPCRRRAARRRGRARAVVGRARSYAAPVARRAHAATSSAPKRGPRQRAAAARRARRRRAAALPSSWCQTNSAAPSAPPGVAGRRLDPEPLERPLAQQPAVGHAVQRDAAGQAQVRARRSAACTCRAIREHDLLGHGLDRRAPGPSRAARVGVSGARGGPPKRSSKRRVRHRQARQ